jgi:hypothetical protein
MATAFENEESMTPEDILLRFRKILGRDMAPEERSYFFLPPEPPAKPEKR